MERDLPTEAALAFLSIDGTPVIEPPAIDRTSTVDGQSTLVSKLIADSAGPAATKLTAEVSTGSRMMSPFAYR